MAIENYKLKSIHICNPQVRNVDGCLYVDRIGKVGFYSNYTVNDAILCDIIDLDGELYRYLKLKGSSNTWVEIVIEDETDKMKEETPND